MGTRDGRKVAQLLMRFLWLVVAIRYYVRNDAYFATDTARSGRGIDAWDVHGQLSSSSRRSCYRFRLLSNRRSQRSVYAPEPERSHVKKTNHWQTQPRPSISAADIHVNMQHPDLQASTDSFRRETCPGHSSQCMRNLGHQLSKVGLFDSVVTWWR